MIMNYGCEHIIIGSCIINIEKATADLESKYRKVCVVYLHTKYILKGKTQNFEIFYLVNKFRLVFYVTKSNIT